MSKVNNKSYFNGGCSTCIFANRDERGRYIGSCSGFSNCSYKEYKGKTDITEEEKDKTIANLEAKLAESEKRIKDLEFTNKNLEHLLKVAPNANAGQRARIVELKGINHQLKQQLAEKEKLLKKYLATSCPIYQDKISFAVEQLEKVKTNILSNITFGIESVGIMNSIDNQIKELKGVK